MGVERRGRLIVRFACSSNQGTKSPCGRRRVGKSGSAAVKSFDIPKALVWQAYWSVKANKGAPGVDGQSIDDFDQDRDNNLYRIWSASSRTGGEAVS